MFRHWTMLVAVLSVTAVSVWTQAPPRPDLFFREDWSGNPAPRDCVNLHDARCEPALTQAAIANPDIELKVYGGGKPRIEDGEMLGAVLIQGRGLFTGMAESSYAVTFRDKKNYVDLSGLGRIRWELRASGLNVVHPVVRLADGQWLLGEHADGGNQFERHVFEHTVSEQRWIRLDIDNVMTLGPRQPEPVDRAKANILEREFAAARGVWLESRQVDLTRVDVVGFADLMRGSGHGYGGYIGMGTIEVYGKKVPR